jgi:pantothenate synthetase
MSFFKTDLLAVQQFLLELPPVYTKLLNFVTATKAAIRAKAFSRLLIMLTILSPLKLPVSMLSNRLMLTAR